ncbi:MAG TPA: hypothetical protein VK904_08080 [Miltoncostaeaceae bacterium]|nr:hypothetical protein [Miltoncostaeaceae bacterium]
MTDMGSLPSFSFHGPDGGWHEVIWVKPDGPLEEGLERPATDDRARLSGVAETSGPADGQR